MYVNDVEKRLKKLLYLKRAKISADGIKMRYDKSKNKENITRKKPTWKIWHEKNNEKQERKKQQNKKIEDLMGDPRYWGC